jgi:hypothetical protein
LEQVLLRFPESLQAQSAVQEYSEQQWVLLA